MTYRDLLHSSLERVEAFHQGRVRVDDILEQDDSIPHLVLKVAHVQHVGNLGKLFGRPWISNHVPIINYGFRRNSIEGEVASYFKSQFLINLAQGGFIQHSFSIEIVVNT